MQSRDAVYQKIVTLLTELFEIDPEMVSEGSLLYEDLDVDSIDAVDLMVELKAYTSKKMAPDDFKSVRSVGDVVNAVHKIITE